MPCFLGLDTSNYTTSVSLYDSGSGTMIMRKKLLPVRQGECGLRQSDAVFHHTVQLPELVQEVLAASPGKIAAVGVSDRPRDAEGSYMPCFLVGKGAGEMIASALDAPVYGFSHQSGHIAAALFSAEHTELVGKRFLAFHVSGGTTEALLVEGGGDRIFSVQLVGKTLDLNAGQLIDRVGVMLGLPFPCGAELERFAEHNTEPVKARVTLKGSDCCLSGGENICRRAFEGGRTKEYTAALCLEIVGKTIDGMCEALLEEYGDIPVVFAGGVMSDRIIKERLLARYGAYFAQPAYSADNASGTAFLCSIRHKMN